MISVLVAEDMRILRDALVEILTHEDDMEVVAAVGSGDVIVSTAERVRPDIALIDIELPGRDGIDAAAELRLALPGCRTLILTGVGRADNLRRSVDAKVDGFMLKDAPAAEFVNAIRTIAAGGTVLDPQLAYKTLNASQTPLTARETEVLQLTAAGADPRGIARELYLSYGTVRNYLASAVMKLGARNRIDAVRIATEAGWLR